MNKVGQKKISKQFDELYKSETTPWKYHDPEPALDEFIKLLKNKKPGAKILDIGCGDGWISVALAKLGFTVTGIDSSETAIKNARKLAEKEKVEVEFTKGDALDLPYEKGVFDALIDRGLFHHILPENRESYLKNILKVLKKDSLVFLSVFTMRNPEGMGQRFTVEKIKDFFGDDFKILKKEVDPWPTNNPAHLFHFIMERVST